MKKHFLSTHPRIKYLEEKIRAIEIERDLKKNVSSEIEKDGVKYIPPKELGIKSYTYTQSTIFPFEVKKTLFEGKYDTENYIVKEYNDDLFTMGSSSKNYNTEKIIYPIIKSEGIFPDLVYFEDSHMRLYFEGLMLRPLNKRVQHKEPDKRIVEASSVFEPLKKCFNGLEKYSDEIKSKLSNEGIEFKNLDAEYYDKKLGAYLKFFDDYHYSDLSGLFDEKKNMIIDSLSREELKRIGPRDLYPWHNLGSKLIDIEGLCNCSMGLPLGSSIGHSSIYESLPDKKGLHTLIEIFWNGFDEKKDIDIKNLENAVYSGAVFSNLRECYGLMTLYGRKYKESIEKNLKTAKSQLEHL